MIQQEQLLCFNFLVICTVPALELLSWLFLLLELTAFSFFSALVTSGGFVILLKLYTIMKRAIQHLLADSMSASFFFNIKGREAGSGGNFSDRKSLEQFSTEIALFSQPASDLETWGSFLRSYSFRLVYI